MTDVVSSARRQMARVSRGQRKIGGGLSIAGSIALHGLSKFVSPSKHVASDNLFSLALVTSPYLSHFMRMILFDRRDINNQGCRDPRETRMTTRSRKQVCIAHFFSHFLRARRLILTVGSTLAPAHRRSGRECKVNFSLLILLVSISKRFP